MANAFVPFFSQISKPQDAGASCSKESFVAVEQSSPASAPVAFSDTKPSPHRPVIKVQRDGDKVRGIRIECGCGEIIELDCIY